MLEQLAAPFPGPDETVHLVDGTLELPGFVGSAFPKLLYDELGQACISPELPRAPLSSSSTELPLSSHALPCPAPS